MEITTFNPEIITQDAAAATRLLEELGFERRHAPALDTVVNAEESAVMRVRMKDAHGFSVDVIQVPGIERDYTAIRINVDDFDAARELLEAHGFQQVPAIVPLELESARLLLMVSPGGLLVDLIQHIKKV